MNAAQVRRLAVVLGVLACHSEKKTASALLKQYYECVTVAGPATTDALQKNPRLEACLMSKGWNYDSASAMAGVVSEMLVLGLTETAKNGKAAGDSLMKSEARKQVGRAYIASMKSDLRNLITSEEAYFADSLKYTTIVGCSSRTRGAILCLTEGNVLGPIKVKGEGRTAGWAATMTNSKLPGVTCAVFWLSASPIPPATVEGQPACQ